MDTNFSPIENYPFLSPFIFNEDPGIIEKHKISILKRLDNVWRPLKIDACQTHEYLAARENVFATVVAEHFEKLFSQALWTRDIPDPDLLIRTSGEERISNFLLWQCAYAEMFFTPTLWPDFGKTDFNKALDVYAIRDRRFGAVKESEG